PHGSLPRTLASVPSTTTSRTNLEYKAVRDICPSFGLGVPRSRDSLDQGKETDLSAVVKRKHLTIRRQPSRMGPQMSSDSAPAAGETIGQRLKRLRLERGLSQRELAAPGA